MARWIYAALAVGWVLSMVYECVQSGGGVALYFALTLILRVDEAKLVVSLARRK